MKTLIAIIAGITFIIAAGLWIQDRCAEPQPVSIPPIEQVVRGLQHRVGAKVDGIIGNETMSKVNAAVKAERKVAERETFNGYAEVFMTASGAPRK